MGRGGQLSLNPIVNPDDVKNQYKSGEPATERRCTCRCGRTSGKPAAAARLIRPPWPPVACCLTSCAATTPSRPPARRTRPQPMAFQRPRGLPDQRKGRLRRPQAARRPPGRVPVPRPGESLTRSYAAWDGWTRSGAGVHGHRVHAAGDRGQHAGRRWPATAPNCRKPRGRQAMIASAASP
jgi:hypothetical protein